MHNIISGPYVIFLLVMIPGEGEFKILIHLQCLYKKDESNFIYLRKA